MTELLWYALTGLALGAALQRAGWSQPRRLREALALRPGAALRGALGLLGLGAMLVSFLSYLAVLDVDTLTVLPLHGGVLLGGAAFGLGAALSGFTPVTALSAAGGPQPLRGLCTLLGCACGLGLARLLPDFTAPLHSLPPFSRHTLFRVTLDEPFLFAGGFLGQGCLGAVLLTLAAWIPLPKPAEEAPTLPPGDEPAHAPADPTIDPASPDAEPAQAAEDPTDSPSSPEDKPTQALADPTINPPSPDTEPAPSPENPPDASPAAAGEENDKKP